MNGSHVVGAGFGAIVGAILSQALKRYAGFGISDADASLIGSAAIGAGVGFAHLVSTVGIIPALRQAVFGQGSRAKGLGDTPEGNLPSQP